ncbi:hypothetical protein K474DRAFT_1707445 [Panus rudis PR-1116 ss-1]|nr:hypothetical protein K474DRAFT_1707445 [Panus rudis PR-1116 ss-1]
MTPNLEQIPCCFYQEPSASNPGRTQPTCLNIPSYRRATSSPGDDPGNGSSNQFKEDQDNNPFYGGFRGNRGNCGGGGGGGDPGDDDGNGSDPEDGDGDGGNNPGSDDEDVDETHASICIEKSHRRILIKISIRKLLHEATQQHRRVFPNDYTRSDQEHFYLLEIMQVEDGKIMIYTRPMISLNDPPSSLTPPPIPVSNKDDNEPQSKVL